MKLLYLDKEAIDELKMNFPIYKSHFKDKTNEWFMERFKEKDWIHESKIQCDEFELDYDVDYNKSDRKNVEIIYEALKDLNPVHASDERLWAGVLFGQLWKFVKYRRAEELNSGEELKILNSFLFMRGRKRSCFINCLSRLWWTGYLLYDPENACHYASVDLISESAFPSNVLLLLSSNFMANKKLALGVLDCISERKQKGEKIGRYHFTEANKYLNCIGGVTFLDAMSREEVKKLVGGRLDKEFGILI